MDGHIISNIPHFRNPQYSLLHPLASPFGGGGTTNGWLGEGTADQTALSVTAYAVPALPERESQAPILNPNLRIPLLSS